MCPLFPTSPARSDTLDVSRTGQTTFIALHSGS
jgi:hypothetical protein